MSGEQLHPFDAAYNPSILSIIRSHIHDSIVKKHHTLTRNDYLIVFDAQAEEIADISYQAGRPLQICLHCSPYNGTRVEELARRAFNMPDSYLLQLLRFHNITLRANAVKWYGIEITGDPIIDQIHQRMLEVKSYPTKVEQEVWIKVTITDPSTGRKVSVRQQNGNAFDAKEEAIRILRSGV
jgi:hypothetical protein